MKIYLDVESAGIKGNLNLIQYQCEKGQIHLIRPFQDIKEVEVLKNLLNTDTTVVVGYNIGFDMWKLYQFYKPSKPFTCQIQDLWLHVLRDKPYNQYPTRGKSVIIIKSIPIKCVEKLEDLITKKLQEWLPKFFEIKVKHTDEKEDLSEEAKNKILKKSLELVTLAFRVQFDLKLKTLVSKIFKQETLEYEDCFNLPDWQENKRVPIILEDEKELYKKLWKSNEEILDNLNSNAWKYASKDIEYLHLIEDWLISCNSYKDVPITDNDTCIHIVAYTKYHGFYIDEEKLKNIKTKTAKKMRVIERACICEGLNPMSFKDKQDYFKLHAIANIKPASLDKKHIQIFVNAPTNECPIDEEGRKFFQNLLEYTSLNQRYKQLETFEAGKGKIYPDFRVYGTTTNRMAGTGGINFQGIARDGDIRELVYCSQGGDFDSLEMGIAATYFKDKQMLYNLDNNIDPHMQAACVLKLIDNPYKEAMSIKKYKIPESMPIDKAKQIKNLQKYLKIQRDKAKTVNFAILYFAEHYSISKVLGLDEDETKKLMNKTYFKFYPQLLKTREEYYRKIVTADTKEWSKNCIENMIPEVEDAVGNIKYIGIEKKIASYFWKKAKNISEEVTEGMTESIIRRVDKGYQKPSNAVWSALLGAVIGIQKTLYRQCGNFPIQSTGATLTKGLMVAIWKKHCLPMMNVHDEIMIPCGYENQYNQVNKTVQEYIQSKKKIVKHLSMDWIKIKNWSEK